MHLCKHYTLQYVFNTNCTRQQQELQIKIYFNFFNNFQKKRVVAGFSGPQFLPLTIAQFCPSQQPVIQESWVWGLFASLTGKQAWAQNSKYRKYSYEQQCLLCPKCLSVLAYLKSILYKNLNLKLLTCHSLQKKPEEKLPSCIGTQDAGDIYSDITIMGQNKLLCFFFSKFSLLFLPHHLPILTNGNSFWLSLTSWILQ